MTQEETMEYYVDGSLILETDSSICIYFKGESIIKTFKDKKKIKELERLAILEALKIAEDNSTIYSDSEQVVKNLDKELYELALKKNIAIIWIPREENPAGKVLERRVKKIHRYFSSQEGYVKKQKKKSRKNKYKKTKHL